MKKSILFAALLSAILMGTSTLILSCGGKTETQEQTEEQTAAEEAEDDDVYACPMHPDVTGKKGDTCSKCNMALEEVEDDDAADSTGMHDH